MFHTSAETNFYSEISNIFFIQVEVTNAYMFEPNPSIDVRGFNNFIREQTPAFVIKHIYMYMHVLLVNLNKNYLLKIACEHKMQTPSTSPYTDIL